MCVYACAHAHAACMWRPEVILEGCSSGVIHFDFETESHWDLGLPIRLAVNKPPETAFICLPSTAITDIYLPSLSLYLGLETGLKPLRLHSRHSTN